MSTRTSAAVKLSRKSASRPSRPEKLDGIRLPRGTQGARSPSWLRQKKCRIATRRPQEPSRGCWAVTLPGSSGAVPRRRARRRNLTMRPSASPWRSHPARATRRVHAKERWRPRYGQASLRVRWKLADSLWAQASTARRPLWLSGGLSGSCAQPPLRRSPSDGSQPPSRFRPAAVQMPSLSLRCDAQLRLRPVSVATRSSASVQSPSRRSPNSGLASVPSPSRRSPSNGSASLSRFRPAAVQIPSRLKLRPDSVPAQAPSRFRAAAVQAQLQPPSRFRPAAVQLRCDARQATAQLPSSFHPVLVATLAERRLNFRPVSIQFPF